MIKVPLLKYYFLIPFAFVLVAFLSACKNKKKMQKTETPVVVADTLNNKCKLDFKNAKALSRYVKENEFTYTWVNAKANVESNIDGKDESFDIRVKIRKDSAMLITIQYLLGLQVAKVLIRKDSVIFVDYIHKNYFKGDFNYINELLNADLDYDVLQAVLFGNSAEFHDDEKQGLNAVTDRTNCHYMLSTERKRRLRKIQQGGSELKKALQTLTLNPDNFKIIKNEFIDPATNRTFTANYKDFTQKDSVYAPYLVDIDIVAEKKAKLKIEYVRIEKNTPQKLDLNIPSKYDPIQIQKKQK
ncbi:MAG: hypothetical protein K0S32_4015 [Bacteroidetes bacterium]|jgi:hypothetical protein|nr:hypothetical protein [Bacteroidota bacterium]